MKTTKTVSKVKFLMMLAAISAAPMTFAQDPLLDDVESVYNSEQIDIDGEYTERRGPSPADRMAKNRRRMEKRNEQMVRKKIENIRLREEKKLARQLRGAFTGSLNRIDDSSDRVRTRQSSTKKVVVERVLPVVEKKKNIKIIPSIGLLSINSSEENIDIESGANFGLNIEGMVHSHISVGLETSFSNVGLVDNTDYGRFQRNNLNSSNNGFLPTGSDANYKRLTVGVNSKFFLTESTFRPYLGLGVAFNRASLKYEDNNTLNSAFTNTTNTEESKFTDSYVSGAIALGAELNFNNTVGLDLELKYQRALGSVDSSDDNDFNNNNTFNAFSTFNTTEQDEDQLESISERIQGSNFLSVKLGLIVKF